MPDVLRDILLLPVPPLLHLPRDFPHLSGGLHHPLLPLPARPGFPSDCLRDINGDRAAEEHVCDGVYFAAKPEAE